MSAIDIKNLIIEALVFQESWKNAINQNKEISEDEMKVLSHKDPSNDKDFSRGKDETQVPNKYLASIAKWYKTEQISLDDSHVKDVLNYYDTLKKKKKLKPEHMNIQNFRYFDNFARIMDEYADENQTVRKDASGDVKYSGNIKKIYDKNGWQVWATKTFEATREFIKYLYDMDDKQLHGHGIDNYEEGICPYCIMQRNYWDDYAGEDKDYTLYWILKDKHEPDIIKGEGHDKVFAMMDTDFDLLDYKDAHYTDYRLKMLPKEFWDIINSLDYHTYKRFESRYIPYMKDSKIIDKWIKSVATNMFGLGFAELTTFPKDLLEKYFKFRLGAENIALTGQEYEYVPDSLKDDYIKKSAMTLTGMSNASIRSLSDSDREKYYDYRIKSGYNLNESEYDYLTDEQFKRYFHKVLGRDPFRDLGDDVYEKFPEDLKKEYIYKMADSNSNRGLTDKQFNDLDDQGKLKYLKTSIEARRYLTPNQYNIIPDDIKLKYDKSLIEMLDFISSNVDKPENIKDLIGRLKNDDSISIEQTKDIINAIYNYFATINDVSDDDDYILYLPHKFRRKRALEYLKNGINIFSKDMSFNKLYKYLSDEDLYKAINKEFANADGDNYPEFDLLFIDKRVIKALIDVIAGNDDYYRKYLNNKHLYTRTIKNAIEMKRKEGAGES